MLNIAFGANIAIGLLFFFAILIFHGLRIVKPELARDEDIFFTTLGFLFCSIIVVHGWRLDPILFFSQVIIIFLIIVTGWENIRLRGQVKKAEVYLQTLENLNIINDYICEVKDLSDDEPYDDEPYPTGEEPYGDREK